MADTAPVLRIHPRLLVSLTVHVCQMISAHVTRARSVRLYLTDTNVFHLSLSITDIFALLEPQLKDVTVHFFLQYVGHKQNKWLHRLHMKRQIVSVFTKEKADRQ